jgi:hypothetical protein
MVTRGSEIGNLIIVGQPVRRKYLPISDNTWRREFTTSACGEVG